MTFPTTYPFVLDTSLPIAPPAKPYGKGMYLWQIRNAEGGDPNKIANAALSAGLTHVIIKILDGQYAYNRRSYTQDGVTKWADDILGPVVNALQAKRIQAWGYQWLELDNPIREANAAIERVAMFGMDGFVINAEAPCGGKSAKSYIETLWKGLRVPIALSSYRYPSMHPDLDWEGFKPYLDYAMPQVYWVEATNPAYQLGKSLAEYEKMYPEIEYFPTGSAYSEHGWVAKPEDILEFMDAAKNKYQLRGCNFWEWAEAKANNLWDTIAGYEWIGMPTTTPPATVSVSDFVINHVYPFMKSIGYTGPVPTKDEG